MRRRTPRWAARLSAATTVAFGALLLLPGSAASADPAPSVTDEDRVVRVGTEGTYPPFTYHEAGSPDLSGYDIEVIEAVAERAGWELEFVETQWDSIFPALDAERIDVIANQVSWNEERAARYGLSEPYTYSSGVIVTASDTDDITSLADLEGRTTAQSATSNWAEVARGAGADVESVEGFAQAAELLAQGRVDAIVNDSIAVLDYLATTGSDDIKIAATLEDEATEQVFAFRQDDGQLLNETNAALAELAADGTLTEISESYFDADVSVPDGGEVDVGQGRDKASSWEILRAEAWPMFKALIKVTIPLTLVSFSLGLVIAVAIALARISGSRILEALGRAYVSIIRGTPLLLQLVIVFFGLPQLGVTISSFVAASIALSLNVGGYAAEIVRSAILSIPKGQFEAAQTIGLDYRKTLQRIVFPQALRTAVPPLSNTLLSLVKDTSLVGVVLLTDLFRVAQNAAAATTEFLLLLSFAGLYYWIICTALAALQKRLEIRLSRHVAR